MAGSQYSRWNESPEGFGMGPAEQGRLDISRHQEAITRREETLAEMNRMQSKMADGREEGEAWEKGGI